MTVYIVCRSKCVYVCKQVCVNEYSSITVCTIHERVCMSVNVSAHVGLGECR